MTPRRPPSLTLSIFRSLAIAILVFALINTLRELLSPGRSAAGILFYLPAISWGSELCVLITAALLVFSAFGPVRHRVIAIVLAINLSGLACLAAFNAVGFYQLLAIHSLSTSWPIPLSAVVAVYLLLHTALCLRPRHAAACRPLDVHVSRDFTWAGAGTSLAVLFGAILFHIHAFGMIDYRRSADAILVFGARVYNDGTPSEALRERVKTAAALYHAGFAKRLIMSGGVESNGISEPKAMREIARSAGVPDNAIIEDEAGVNTGASLKNMEHIGRRHGIQSVLAVSHYFHLPRIHLLADRSGITCFTVPADEGPTLLRGTPYYVLREAAALVYYFAVG